MKGKYIIHLVAFTMLNSILTFGQNISKDNEQYELIINQKVEHNAFDPVFVYDKGKDDIYGFFHAWEKALLKNGLNVITRTKISALLDERNINMSGLTENEKIYKIGEIVGANTVLFWDFGMEGIQNQKLLEKVKLISIKGEILFTADLIFDEKNDLNLFREKIISEYLTTLRKKY